MRIHLMGVMIIIVFALFSCHSAAESKEEEGVKLFKIYCVNCHGIDGSLMTNAAKDLRYSNLSLDERILVITQGRNVMTSFKSTLTREQIKAVANYTIQLGDSRIHAK